MLLAAEGLTGPQKTVLTEKAVSEILSATVTPPPESLQAMGVSHWSSRRLVDHPEGSIHAGQPLAG